MFPSLFKSKSVLERSRASWNTSRGHEMWREDWTARRGGGATRAAMRGCREPHDHDACNSAKPMETTIHHYCCRPHLRSSSTYAPGAFQIVGVGIKVHPFSAEESPQKLLPWTQRKHSCSSRFMGADLHRYPSTAATRINPSGVVLASTRSCD